MKKALIILPLFLAIVFVGFGIYLGTKPHWAEGADYHRYNQGLVHLAENQTKEALSDFAHAAQNIDDARLKSLALCQSGKIIGGQADDPQLSMELRLQAVQSALVLFQEAVIYNPDNEEAKYNLELFNSRLLEILQKIEASGQDGNQPGLGPDYSPGGGSKGY